MDNTDSHSNRMSREDFLKLFGGVVVTGGAGLLLANWDDIFNKKPSDKKTTYDLNRDVQDHVAIARALSHTPQKHLHVFKDPTDFEMRRNAALMLFVLRSIRQNGFSHAPQAGSNHALGYQNTDAAYLFVDDPQKSPRTDPLKGLILNPDPKPLYRQLMQEIGATDLSKMMTRVSKEDLQVAVGFLGGVAGFATIMVAPEIALPLNLLGLGTTILDPIIHYAGGEADPSDQRFSSDQRYFVSSTDLLKISSQILNDPNAKVLDIDRGAMRDIFGIDFSSTVEENRKELPENIRQQVDIYLTNQGLTSDQLSKQLDENSRKLAEQINKSLQESVKATLEGMKKKQEEDKRELYKQNEIKGGVFLAGFLADKLLGNKAGTIVSTIGQSALEVIGLIGASSTMGALGMVAGFTGVAMKLGSLFGGKGASANEVIMVSIKEVQKSITEMREEMRKLFGVVIENQEKMMSRIDLQFDLIGRKQNLALNILKEIYEMDKLDIHESRDRERNARKTELLNQIEILNLEFGKKKNNKKYDTKEVESAISKIYSYGNRTSLYGDFTRLNIPGGAVGSDNVTRNQFDAQNVVTKLNTLDQVDYFVGIIPLLMNRYAETQKIGNIHNPVELSGAAIYLGAAYMMFPEIARNFEKDARAHYIQDFQNALSGTRDSLLGATSTAAIDEFKASYMDIVAKNLAGALENAEIESRKTNAIVEGRRMKPVASGPLAPIHVSPVTESWDALFSSKDNEYVLDHYHQVRNGRTLTPAEGRQMKGQAYFVGNEMTWTGLDGDTKSQKTFSRDDFFTALQKWQIVDLEEGPVQTGRIQFYSPTLDNPNVGFPVDCNETYRATKITVLQEKQNIILGNAINSGWLKGRLDNNIPPERASAFAPLFSPAHFNFSAISSDLLGHDYVRNSSYHFLNQLTDTANLMYNVRSYTINYAKDNIVSKTNDLSLELEAAAQSLKYLAGVNAYIKTGDIKRAKDIATDRLAGVNNHMEIDGDGSVVSNKDKSLLISTRKQLADLIGVVTSKDYLEKPEGFVDLIDVVGAGSSCVYPSKRLTDRVDSRLDLREYIESEVYKVVESAFDEYRNVYFPPKENMFRVDEIATAMSILSGTSKMIGLNSKKGDKPSVFEI